MKLLVKFFLNIRAELKRTRELKAQLENLTDYGLIDRITAGDAVIRRILQAQHRARERRAIYGE